MKKLTWITGLILLVTGSQAVYAGADTMMIVPSRPQAVLLGQDMAMLRDCNLVTFHGDSSTTDPKMFAWYRKAWRGIDARVLGSPSSYENQPKTVLIFGHPNDLPPVIEDAARRICSNVRVIPTLDMVTMISTLNEVYDFSGGEWKAIARRYGLTIKDINESRRRYGRYGPPGGRAMSDTPSVDNSRSFDLEPLPLEPEPVRPIAPAPIPAPVPEPTPAPATPDKPLPAPAKSNLIAPGSSATLEMNNDDPPPARIIGR